MRPSKENSKWVGWLPLEAPTSINFLLVGCTTKKRVK